MLLIYLLEVGGCDTLMILMIDNYDSFTYNLVHYLEMLEETVTVASNDALSLKDIRQLQPDLIVLSPGPGKPDQAGISLSVVTSLQGIIPILGICLGHQIIGQALGGKTVCAQEPIHGKVLPLWHKGRGVFRSLPNPLQVTRYHSLVLEKETLPPCLEITAVSAAGEIMGLRHKEHLIEGVQFHPEALLTQGGLKLLENFLLTAKSARSKACT